MSVLPGKEADNLLSRMAATEMGLVKWVNEKKRCVSEGRKAENRISENHLKLRS